ncbi:deaminase [Actinoplanes aureus]|uniref:dCMP deaminase n=1 Tax=Actinoplanes aureus TaxID=2792083 RepID=A0A931CI45_9ACTN|nr:deaminase [Actinoplanes aureus]MBG0567561.1 dCMP deaminase [Actinoplanes aureus]
MTTLALPDTDRHWMHAAITVSRTAPLVPTRYAVGAIIVDHDGSVLATGYTGETDPAHHAEEVALARIPGVDLSRATIYTTLEPCTMRASRPAACTNLLLAAGIGRVVLALREPLLFADCDGVETLREYGVEVLELPDLAQHVRDVNAHVLAPAVAP